MSVQWNVLGVDADGIVVAHLSERNGKLTQSQITPHRGSLGNFPPQLHVSTSHPSTHVNSQLPTHSCTSSHDNCVPTHVTARWMKKYVRSSHPRRRRLFTGLTRQHRTVR